MKRFALSVLAAVVAATPAFGQVAVEAADASSKIVAENATAAQRQWLAALPEQRIKLAENIGEEGARAMAKKQGLKPLMDGLGKTLPQGPDQIYQATDGTIHVFEAKGGSSQTIQAYGHLQGTPEWAVKSAERVIRSSKASAAEKQAAHAVLDAAAKGKLQVQVIRTTHVLGEPTATIVERSVKCTDQATKLAQIAIEDLAKAAAKATESTGASIKAGTTVTDDATRVGADLAGGAAQAGKSASKLATVTKGASKVAVPIAFGFDAWFRFQHGEQTEQQFANGEINQQQREIEHAKNVAGMAGGWGGALVGAKVGGAGGAAAGSCVAPGPGTAIGYAAGAVAGGIGGYFGGEAAAEAGAEWAVQKVHAAGTTVAEIAQVTWDETTAAAAWTADKACQAGQAVSNGTAAAWDTAKSGGQWVGGKAYQAWNWAFGD